MCSSQMNSMDSNPQPMLLQTLLVGRYYVPSELKIHMMGGYEINLKGFLSPYRDPQVINSHLMSIIIIRYLIIIIDIKWELMTFG